MSFRNPKNKEFTVDNCLQCPDCDKETAVEIIDMDGFEAAIKGSEPKVVTMLPLKKVVWNDAKQACKNI